MHLPYLLVASLFPAAIFGIPTMLQPRQEEEKLSIQAAEKSPAFQRGLQQGMKDCAVGDTLDGLREPIEKPSLQQRSTGPQFGSIIVPPHLKGASRDQIIEELGINIGDCMRLGLTQVRSQAFLATSNPKDHEKRLKLMLINWLRSMYSAKAEELRKGSLRRNSNKLWANSTENVGKTY